MHCQAAAIAQLVRAWTAMHKVRSSILSGVSFLLLNWTSSSGSSLEDCSIIQRSDYWSIILPRGDYGFTRGPAQYTCVDKGNDFGRLWGHYPFRTALEIKSDLIFEFKDPKYLQSHVHIASKYPYDLWGHYGLQTASEVKSDLRFKKI